MKLHPYGENALYVDLEIDDAVDRRARTQAVARALRARLPGADVVLGAGSIAVIGVSGWDNLDDVVADAMRAAGSIEAQGRMHDVPVVYDGPDLDEIAAKTGLSRDEVVALHSGCVYEVELIGFLPGFAYLAPLDARLVVGRRAAPRPRVAAASVAIAGPYTAIYPLASPGGWNLIGRAVATVAFDPGRDPPALFAPGDRVHFVPTDGD
jgi:KipI family sensor histidine kinase inhibitor